MGRVPGSDGEHERGGVTVHTQPMSESQGTLADEKPSDCKCPSCGNGPVFYAVWESSCGGYEDYKYRCAACGHRWWIEGCDS